MADIDVERRSGAPWVWWIIGIIILALIIWGIAEAMEPDEPDVAAAVPPAVVAAAPVAPAPGAVPVLVVHEIVVGPQTWVGKRVSGTAQVSGVPTDRGFWLGSGSDRIFVVLNDQPAETPIDINPGQTVQLTDALVVTDFSQVPGTVEAETREIAQQQPVFLDVDEANVKVVNGAAEADSNTADTASAGMAGTPPTQP
jgi:hypothetical protein